MNEIATLFLDLPANIEAGMLLVASCPCGGLVRFRGTKSGSKLATPHAQDVKTHGFRLDQVITIFVNDCCNNGMQTA